MCEDHKSLFIDSCDGVALVQIGCVKHAKLRLVARFKNICPSGCHETEVTRSLNFDFSAIERVARWMPLSMPLWLLPLCLSSYFAFLSLFLSSLSGDCQNPFFPKNSGLFLFDNKRLPAKNRLPRKIRFTEKKTFPPSPHFELRIYTGADSVILGRAIAPILVGISQLWSDN